MDAEDIRLCMDSALTISLVEHDIATARSLGMSATPTFYAVPLDNPSSYIQIDGADENAIDSFLALWVKT